MILHVPRKDILGDVNTPVKVEKSWGENLDNKVKAGVVVSSEFDREAAILKAVELRKQGKVIHTEEDNVEKVFDNRQVSLGKIFHFFVFKGNTLEYIGSKQMDDLLFKKDFSGKFFREWLKKVFPDRDDYLDIVSFDNTTMLKQVVELISTSNFL